MADPTAPKMLLRLEGLAVFVFALVFFAVTGGNWWLLLMLILAPDLSMLGYLAGPKTGAAIYNVVHTYTLPAGLAAIGLLAAYPLTLSLGLVWAAHIAIDRVLGFGLKYPTGFKDTHLHRI